MSGNSLILKMENITKSFPGVKALKGVNFELRKGEVHALVGENGAGKTTLMNVLNGLVQKDSGKIIIDGREVNIITPSQAREAGISFIHQELELIPELTVKENMLLGQETRKGLFRLIDWKAMESKTRDFLKKLDIHLDPNEKILNLSIAQQQLVEIAKALYQNARIIVMDEPTSSLTDEDVKKLFKIIRDLKNQGCAIIYVSHVMDEIFEISDRITVLRDGMYIGTEVTKDTTRDKIFSMIVGKDIKRRYIREEVKKGNVILKVVGLTYNGIFQDINFELRAGELIGIAGLMGAGRTELLEALFGIIKEVTGEIYVNGKKVCIKSPESAIKNGLYYISENRRDKGLFPTLSVADNIVVSSMDQHIGLFGIKKSSIIESSKKLINQLNIKTPSLKQVLANLSGGNQQKVILARGIKTEPKIIMLNEPTRGIDVGTKVEIYKLLNRLKARGLGILMISSELPEVMEISDKILVMSAGKISGIFDNISVTKEQILSAMFKYVEKKAANGERNGIIKR